MNGRELAGLIYEAWKLREVLDVDVPDKAYNPKVHLARRYTEVMSLLRDELNRMGVGELEFNQNGKQLVLTARKTRDGKWITAIKAKVKPGG